MGDEGSVQHGWGSVRHGCLLRRGLWWPDIWGSSLSLQAEQAVLLQVSATSLPSPFERGASLNLRPTVIINQALQNSDTPRWKAVTYCTIRRNPANVLNEWVALSQIRCSWVPYSRISRHCHRTSARKTYVSGRALYINQVTRNVT